jgi:LacI family transcriptional regulator
MPRKRHVGIALRIDFPFPPFPQLLNGIRRYADEQPTWTYTVDPSLIASTGVTASGARQYDGVVTRTSLWAARRLRAAGVPVVNTQFAGISEEFAGVYVDTARCGELAADHLLDRGYRRFAYLGPYDEPQPEAIGQAFTQALADLGHNTAIKRVNDNVLGDDYWPTLTKQLKQFLDRLEPPVGVLVAKGWVARFLATLCEARGWRLAEQLALIAMDNVKDVLELSPQISSLSINYQQIGYEAAAELDRLMADEPVSASGRHLLVPPTGILARESTDYFAVEDETVAAALRFASGHLREPLSVERVADEVAVSPRTLQRRFDQALGRGVSEEIRRLRLELAKRLLREEHRPISQIARETGIGSRVTMNYLFNRELGMSPSAYRVQVLGK